MNFKKAVDPTKRVYDNTQNFSLKNTLYNIRKWFIRYLTFPYQHATGNCHLHKGNMTL